MLEAKELSGSRGTAGVMQDVCDTGVRGEVILLFLLISPAALYGRQDRDDVRTWIDPGDFLSFDHSWSKSVLDIFWGGRGILSLPPPQHLSLCDYCGN